MKFPIDDAKEEANKEEKAPNHNVNWTNNFPLLSRGGGLLEGNI